MRAFLYATNRAFASTNPTKLIFAMSSQGYGLKSKDFSDFSKSKAVFESRSDGSSLQSRICEYCHIFYNRCYKGRITATGISMTESQLEAGKAIIANPSAISKVSKVTKQVINTLLASAKSLAELLGIVSEAVPPTEPIAEIFKSLLKLELDRQDNDKRIAVLYHSMSTMLIVLAKLDNVFDEQGDLAEILNRKLDDIVGLLNEFGNFCDVYYKHRTVVRFLRISRYNNLVNDFAESFANTRQELEALILNHTTLVVMQTSNTVDLIARELSELTKFMNTQTSRERDAQELVKSKGGVEKVSKASVLRDNDLICEVSTKLGDPIRSSAQTNRSIQYSLNEDLSRQIRDNQSVWAYSNSVSVSNYRTRALFVMKLTSVKEELAEAINKSTITILRGTRFKLDAGPHEVINDHDIKSIWRAVQYHFEQQFRRYMNEHEGAQHPDCWTLNYLSRVISIADAIDEGDEVAENVRLIVDSAEAVNLVSLREKYAEHVTKEVEERLDQAKYTIDDTHTLSLIIGIGNRLESRLLCVIHRLLKRHHKIFDIAKDKPLQEGITISMTASLQVIFEAFTKRTRSLMESWRQQRLDANLQAEWYEKGAESDEEYDEQDLSEEESTDELEELEDQATRPPTEDGSVVETEARSDEEHSVDEADDGSDEAEGVDTGVDDLEGDDNGDKNSSRDCGTCNQFERSVSHTARLGSKIRTGYQRDVERRLDRLEGQMDELKGLMLKILEHLDG
ncbi:hypothetical protein AG1IA_02287 [Rhizoctonia solani AG-1 IA]|uniref:Uncharacterized protein n=1 Tax=Thanatephorus cucumeris (strain AG1-IA) TaxID=983506 RepID=L8X3R9_THACA|nr:hypothetical protein AG1IA_02287 [Rhizoctonia solani AG-1 IA]